MTTSPVINPRPKARFQSNQKLMQSHGNLVRNPDFQTLLDYSIMEYQSMLAEVKMDKFDVAAAMHMKMQGALEFIDVMKRLGHQVPEPVIVDRTNLDNNS